MICSSSVISNNYKPKKQVLICKEFNVSPEDFLVVSHKENCYKGMLSSRASFRPKQTSAPGI